MQVDCGDGRMVSCSVQAVEAGSCCGLRSMLPKVKLPGF